MFRAAAHIRLDSNSISCTTVFCQSQTLKSDKAANSVVTLDGLTSGEERVFRECNESKPQRQFHFVVSLGYWHPGGPGESPKWTNPGEVGHKAAPGCKQFSYQSRGCLRNKQAQTNLWPQLVRPPVFSTNLTASL